MADRQKQILAKQLEAEVQSLPREDDTQSNEVLAAISELRKHTLSMGKEKRKKLAAMFADLSFDDLTVFPAVAEQRATKKAEKIAVGVRKATLGRKQMRAKVLERFDSSENFDDCFVEYLEGVGRKQSLKRLTTSGKGGGGGEGGRELDGHGASRGSGNQVGHGEHAEVGDIGAEARGSAGDANANSVGVGVGEGGRGGQREAEKVSSGAVLERMDSSEDFDEVFREERKGGRCLAQSARPAGGMKMKLKLRPLSRSSRCDMRQVEEEHSSGSLSFYEDDSDGGLSFEEESEDEAGHVVADVSTSLGHVVLSPRRNVPEAPAASYAVPANLPPSLVAETILQCIEEASDYEFEEMDEDEEFVFTSDMGESDASSVASPRGKGPSSFMFDDWRSLQ